MKLYAIGMIKRDRRKITIIFTDATTPNSFKIFEFVRIKVANPDAVVRFVIKVAFPIFAIILCKDFA